MSSTWNQHDFSGRHQHIVAARGRAQPRPGRFAVVSGGGGVLDHLTRDLTPGEREKLVRGGAEAITKATLNGVYRAFSRPSSRRGHVHHEIAKDRVMRAPIANHRRVRAGPDLGFFYGMMGCKDVRVKKLRCVSDGNEDCAYETRWR